jgi:hypothetical protein
MRKIEETRQLNVIGGATTHYHWFCNVNNYRGAKSSTRAGAERGVASHRANYPSHYYNTYVISCSGNC